MNNIIVPYFGYLASLMLIVALLVNSDLKFRWYNIMGTIAFIIYAIVIGSIPVLLTNLILMGINAYYLIKIYRKNENFDLLEFKGDEKMILKFLEFYQHDINVYFAEFDKTKMMGNLNFVVTRDLVIANIFSATVDTNGDAQVLINFTTKKYRDYKVGTFIFEKERNFLISKNVKRIIYNEIPYKKHLQFLKVMEFKIEDGFLTKKI